MYTTPEAEFLKRAHAGENVFLTGMAGTGKSFKLREYVDEARNGTRNGELSLAANSRSVRVDLTAPTGVAALNIGGMTVHRWSGMLIGPKEGESREACAERLEADGRPSLLAGRNRVRRAQVLVIDEISMMPGRQLDFLDFWMRRQRRDQRPFGGVQVIMVGDFLQLPPVRIGEAEPYDWAFTSAAWGEAKMTAVELTQVRRQDEPEFVRALGAFRRGEVDGPSMKILQARVAQFPRAELVRILPRNDAVDKWNDAMLENLHGEAKVFEAVTAGPEAQLEFLVKNLLTPETLALKVGARVMFTRNDKAGRWVNGSVGEVLNLTEESADVELGGVPVCVVRERWQFDGEDSNSARFEQLPLRLAYAMTIHKSQGATLDGAFVDIRAAREPGQAYVAISRVRTLAGLHLKGWPKGVVVSKAAMRFYGK